VSDHFSTLTKVSNFSKSSKPNDVYYRKCDLSEKQWDNYSFDLGNILYHEFPSGYGWDVNYQAYTVSNALNILGEKYMPERKLSKKRQKRVDKPWMTAGLKKAVLGNLSFSLFHVQEMTPNIMKSIKLT